MIGLLDWLALWRQRRYDAAWRRGYDWAAGEILRGDSTVQEIFDQAVMPGPFDRGAQAAIQRLVALRVVSTPW